MRTYGRMPLTVADRDRWTLPDVLAHRASTHGDRIYLDVPHEGVALTYREVHERARRVARGLLASAAPGDRVLVMAPNCSAYVLTWLATSLAGMVEVPVNTAYHGTFLEHQAAVTRPRIAVIAADHAARFVDSAEHCRSIDVFYLIGDHEDRGRAARALRAAGWRAEPWERLEEAGTGTLPAVSPRDLASIFFTSGTTGPSKGVMMCQAQTYFFSDQCVALTRLTDRDAYLTVGPLFHSNARYLVAFPALIAGARFVLRPRFSASRWAGWVRDSGVTVTNLLGVMMDFVWKQPPRDDDADNDLRCVFSAPTAWSILDGFAKRFGVEAFVEVFGLTETSLPIMTPYGQSRPEGSAGLLVDRYFDVDLVDPETDEPVPPGAVGELVVRPRLPWIVTQGYFGMPDRTAEACRNLWFHTGDGLRRDEDGWYYFVDRLSDSLRRRGENISSYEVEQALLGHPGVAEAAVVAVPSDVEAGEDEVLAVVVASGDVSAEDLWAWAQRRLPGFAVPRYLRFLDELPKTPSSKIQKASLRAAGVDGRTADRHAAGAG